MRRAALPPLLGSLVLGLLAGVLWWALAPTAEVVVVGDLVVAPGVQELEATQEVTFALTQVLAGLVAGVALAGAPGAAPVARSAGVLGGGLLGAVTAWGTGMALGPASVPVQQAAGQLPLTSPVRIAAYGALALWPAVAASVAFVGLLLTGARTGRGAASGARSGERVEPVS